MTEILLARKDDVDATSAINAKNDAEAARDAAITARDDAQNFAAALSGTSTTNLTIETGTKVFTTQSGKQWVAGQRLRAASDDTTLIMDGDVVSYTGTTLTLDVDYTEGAGAHADWNISIGGTQGPQGIQGDQGIQGVQGDPGPAGADGSKILFGTGAPANGLGSIGDYYKDEATRDVYEKTGASAWTLRGNDEGAQGPVGATGATGPQGIQGPQGDQGPTGATGAQGIQGIQGPAGDDGQDGTGAVPQGTYNAGTVYSLNDGVTFDGSFWRSLQNSNQGNTPDVSPAFWEQMVAKGDPGDASAGGNVSGNLNMQDNQIIRPLVADYAVKNDNGSFAAGTLTLNYENGPDFDFELSANITGITINSWPASGPLGKVTIQFRQPTAGAFTINFTGIDFGDAGAPVMPTGTGALLEVVIWSRDGGTTDYGAKVFEKVGA
ncbi:hypothetical protein [Pelagibius sp.]|uniref:hypothetical protein n=1 Tax=Pelagibius sp. TaxID=1931238 RepID=UPI003BB132F3